MKSFLLRFKGTIFASAQPLKNDGQNEWKDHVAYVYGPFDRVWAEEPPLRFAWIEEYMFIYLQTYYEKHWILRIFYIIFWISIFNTCSYGQLFTGVSPKERQKHLKFHKKSRVSSHAIFDFTPQILQAIVSAGLSRNKTGERINLECKWNIAQNSNSDTVVVMRFSSHYTQIRQCHVFV